MAADLLLMSAGPEAVGFCCCCPARMVPPLASQPSSSSSARSAKTSGSSSSGGSVDIQHMRLGSKIMLPTRRAPDANELTGDPTEEPVRCVMRAGRVEVPMAASKSRSAWSLPSHRRVCGFHFISPTTAIGGGEGGVRHSKESAYLSGRWHRQGSGSRWVFAGSDWVKKEGL